MTAHSYHQLSTPELEHLLSQTQYRERCLFFDWLKTTSQIDVNRETISHGLYVLACDRVDEICAELDRREINHNFD